MSLPQHQISVKIKYGDEIRRFRIDAGATTFLDFRTKVQELFRLDESEILSRLKYQDEEEDWVSFNTMEEFQEALQMAQTNQLSVLQFMIPKAEQAESSEQQTVESLLLALAREISNPRDLIAFVTGPLFPTFVGSVVESLRAQGAAEQWSQAADSLREAVLSLLSDPSFPLRNFITPVFESRPEQPQPAQPQASGGESSTSAPQASTPFLRRPDGFDIDLGVFAGRRHHHPHHHHGGMRRGGGAGKLGCPYLRGGRRGWMDNIPSNVHIGVACDGCGVSPIVGVRHKCTTCHDFDYCSECMRTKAGEHPEAHKFEQFPERRRPHANMTGLNPFATAQQPVASQPPIGLPQSTPHHAHPLTPFARPCDAYPSMAPPGLYFCDVCGDSATPLYHCTTCPDFDLCKKCFEKAPEAPQQQESDSKAPMLVSPPSQPATTFPSFPQEAQPSAPVEIDISTSAAAPAAPQWDQDDQLQRALQESLQIVSPSPYEPPVMVETPAPAPALVNPYVFVGAPNSQPSTSSSPRPFAFQPPDLNAIRQAAGTVVAPLRPLAEFIGSTVQNAFAAAPPTAPVAFPGAVVPPTQPVQAPVSPVVAQHQEQLQSPVPQPQQPVKWQEELRLLNDMGFVDNARNVQLLEKRKGNVPRVIDDLFRM